MLGAVDFCGGLGWGNSSRNTGEIVFRLVSDDDHDTSNAHVPRRGASG